VDVNSTSELQVQVGKHRPGDKVTVTFIRNGKETTLPIVLKNVAGNTSVVTAAMNGESVFGAKLAALGSADKQEMKVDYGVKVVELSEGKFKDLGIKKGYVILSVNGKKVKNASEVRQYTNNETSLKSIGGVQTDGTVFSYQFGN
jgi:S1-C subfamily serine protease